MHELALSSAVVNTVVKHAAGRPVTAVNLTVGALRQVVPESLEFYFEIVGRDTVCEGARLNQELIPARLRCPECRLEWEAELPIFRCGTCGAAADVESGEEFQVESIEVEEVAACTAPR
jgi:hydrogenase nickel incorporation protein HypA/HybF